ncbi:MAG: hypothetical protein FWC91_11290 [Defluviitaleaceae bacterium]|nr:hypothetical protein [Defluviitaleaceae bacterium]
MESGMDIFNVLGIPALVAVIIGATLGLMLGIADKFLKVELDKRVETIQSMLPGSNCGACGHPGCGGLADAVVEGKGKLKDCPPLKADQEKLIREYLANAEGPNGERLDMSKV